jgi:outer membrane protein assembly factor BamE
VLISTVLTGCGGANGWGFPYKASVQQGNWITQEQIALLQPGMTREQVRFALGSPTLSSVLHANRWDYPYFFKPGYGHPSERKFTVFFQNDLLVRWEGDAQPELQPFQVVEQDATKSAVRQRRIAEEAGRQRDGAQPQGQFTPRIRMGTDSASTDASSVPPAASPNSISAPVAPAAPASPH